MLDIADYLQEIATISKSGQATEHTYRPALQKLFDSITNDVKAYNEPKGVKVGRPDFVFVREAGKGAEITVGHCEAKDVGIGLNPKAMSDFNRAQHGRYVKALPNLMYSNVLDKIKAAGGGRAKDALRQIVNAPEIAKARSCARRFAGTFEDIYPKAVACLRDDLDELLTCFRYKSPIARKRVRTTNAIERRFREVRRRTRPMGTFQDKTPIDRILFASSQTKTDPKESVPSSS